MKNIGILYVIFVVSISLVSCEKNDLTDTQSNQESIKMKSNVGKIITIAQRERIVGVTNHTITYCPPQQPQDSCKSNRPSNIGTLVIVGDDAFATKTDTRDPASGWTNFYRIKDFESSSPVTYHYTVMWKNGTKPIDIGHGNGMAYYRTPGTDPTVVGSFYLAMMRDTFPIKNQIIQVNATGEITKAYKAKRGIDHKSIASITHCGSGNFIVGTKFENYPDPLNPDIIWKPYYTATKDESTSYFELDKKFYVPTTKTFNIGQDIHYHNGDLMVPVWDGKNNVGTATGRKNRIIEVEIGDVSTIVDETFYNTKRWINLTVPESEVDKFEFEGIYKNANGNIIVSANESLSTDPAYDGIYKITAAQ